MPRRPREFRRFGQRPLNQSNPKPQTTASSASLLSKRAKGASGNLTPRSASDFVPKAAAWDRRQLSRLGPQADQHDRHSSGNPSKRTPRRVLPPVRPLPCSRLPQRKTRYSNHSDAWRQTRQRNPLLCTWPGPPTPLLFHIHHILGSRPVPTSRRLGSTPDGSARDSRILTILGHRTHPNYEYELHSRIDSTLRRDEKDGAND